MWAKSLYRSRAERHFLGKQTESWAGLGLVGSTEKKLFDQLWATFEGSFFMFSCPKNRFELFLKIPCVRIKKLHKKKVTKTPKIFLNFFFLIPMKISHKLCDRMDGTLFWCFPWFPANSLLCVILLYTVYVLFYWICLPVQLLYNDSACGPRGDLCALEQHDLLERENCKQLSHSTWGKIIIWFS